MSGMSSFSVPPTQPEPPSTQLQGGEMLTSSFEMIKLQRIIYINIYEITELAMSCTLVRNFTYLLVDTGMPLSAPSPQGNHTRTQGK